MELLPSYVTFILFSIFGKIFKNLKSGQKWTKSSVHFFENFKWQRLSWKLSLVKKFSSNVLGIQPRNESVYCTACMLEKGL